MSRIHGRLVLALATLSIIYLGAACGAAAAPAIESGIFEGLMLAVDGDGRVTGFYREEQGEGVTKTCSFFLAGKGSAEEIPVTTWNSEAFPGTIKAQEDGVELKIERGQDHPGCGLVMLPQIAEGLFLEKIQAAKWSELRVITAPRSYFYADPDMAKKLHSFVVKGDVVGVLSKSGDWFEAEYPGAKKTTRGWIQASETAKLEPPAK